MKNSTVEDLNYSQGFDLGYGQIPFQDLPKVKERLMIALGIKNRVSLGDYRFGRVKMKAHQIEEVKKIFDEYNIRNCFGKSYTTKEFEGPLLEMGVEIEKISYFNNSKIQKVTGKYDSEIFFWNEKGECLDRNNNRVFSLDINFE